MKTNLLRMINEVCNTHQRFVINFYLYQKVLNQILFSLCNYKMAALQTGAIVAIGPFMSQNYKKDDKRSFSACHFKPNEYGITFLDKDLLMSMKSVGNSLGSLLPSLYHSQSS